MLYRLSRPDRHSGAGQIAFDETEEKTALRTAPIRLLWDAARVDLIVGYCGQCLKFSRLLRS
jgi:hypothetical protein